MSLVLEIHQCIDDVREQRTEPYFGSPDAAFTPSNRFQESSAGTEDKY